MKRYIFDQMQQVINLIHIAYDLRTVINVAKKRNMSMDSN